MAVLPVVLGWSAGANLWILAIGLALGILLKRAQPVEWCSDFQAIFLLGLTVRVAVHVAIFGWASASGGPYLSPDATSYFRESLLLAQQDLQLPAPPYVFFGTFDCAHYYLFGAARWLLAAGLFDLQMLNIVLSSVVGPLTYAIARRLHVMYAFPVGVVVALYPSLIALSANDLMKDASVIGLFIIGVWAMAELWLGPASRSRQMVLVAVAAVSLVYVRMSRFYVPAFLECAVLAALGFALVKHLRGASVSLVSRQAIVCILAVITLVEGVPMLFGWGSSPVMVWQALNHSLGTPEMRLSAVGMVDRLQSGGVVGPRHRGDLSATGNLSTRASDIEADVQRPVRSRRASANVMPEIRAEPAERGAPEPPLTWKQRSMRLAANGVRKLFGPFPWVMPPSWDARTILVGDYLMFPGMIIWYLMLPFALVGLIVVPWQAIRQSEFAFPLLALSGLATVLFAQYLVLNLSYRQREFMFPFLALAAAFAISHQPASRWVARIYVVYLGGIAALALVHTALRSGLF